MPTRKTGRLKNSPDDDKYLVEILQKKIKNKLNNPENLGKALAIIELWLKKKFRSRR